MSTLSDTSNKYALAALRERRAELAGEITAAEQHLRHLREAILHVDGTLRLFDPDADPSKIAAKRPYKRTKLFGAGKLNRLILDALRKAGRPLATAEVVDAIVAELGFGEDAAKGLRNRVRANLLYLSKVRGELCGKLGDDGGLKAAYRGGCPACQNLSPRAIRHERAYQCCPPSSA